MTQVHTDNHILCLFEDVQFHLDELGIQSRITNGRLIFTKDQTDFRIYFDHDGSCPVKVDDRDLFFTPFHEYAVDGMNDIQEYACEFLTSILDEYLKTLAKVVDHEE